MKTLSTSVAIISLLTASGLCMAASDRLEDGSKAYEAACARCHETGDDNAPVTGNAKDWTDRSNLWDAVLSEHAQKGYLRMPAKGGSVDASTYDVDAAAEYMLTITHPDMPHD
jgi:cytochrome c5